MQCDMQSSEERVIQRREKTFVENVAQSINELSVKDDALEKSEMAEGTGIHLNTECDDSRTFATLECMNSHKVYTLPEENVSSKYSNEFSDVQLKLKYSLKNSESSNASDTIKSENNACNKIRSSVRVPPSSLALDLSSQTLEPELASRATPSSIESVKDLSVVASIDPDQCSLISSTGTDFCSAGESEKQISQIVSEEEVSESGEIACGMSENVANKLYELKTSQDNIIDDFSTSSLMEENSDDPECDLQYQQESQNYISGSRSSLRQIYPYISCLPFENNVVFCYILSVWDNIVGPQTVYVWRRKAFPSQRNIDILNSQEPSAVGTPDPNFTGTTPAVKLGEENVKSEQSNSFESLSDRVLDVEEGDDLASETDGSCMGEVSSIPNLEEATSINAFKSISTSMISHSSPPSPKLQSHKHSNSSRSHKKSVDTQSDDGQLLRQHSGPSAQISMPENLGDEDIASNWAYGSRRLRLSTVVKYVTEHSVGVGEIGKPSEKVTTTLLVVPQQGIVVVAARTSARRRGSQKTRLNVTSSYVISSG